jgi:hypothetical protein
MIQTPKMFRLLMLASTTKLPPHDIMFQLEIFCCERLHQCIIALFYNSTIITSDVFLLFCQGAIDNSTP